MPRLGDVRLAAFVLALCASLGAAFRSGTELQISASATATAELQARQSSSVSQSAAAAAVADASAQFLDPVTLTVLSGIAAAGSIASIGKTTYQLVQQKKEIAAAKALIEEFADISTRGCAMLEQVGELLALKLEDYRKLSANAGKLKTACQDEAAVASYKALLRGAFEVECHSLRAEEKQRRCRAMYLDRFDEHFGRACEVGDSTTSLESQGTEALVQQMWRMDGLMEVTCGKRLPALHRGSLLQTGAAASSSTVVLDVLGFAFTMVSFADMGVDVADSAITVMRGSSTEMLSKFLESKKDEMTETLCAQSAALWQLFLPMHAARAVLTADLRRSFLESGAADGETGALLDRALGGVYSRIWQGYADDGELTGHFVGEAWGLRTKSYWVCNARKWCLEPFQKDYIGDEGRKQNDIYTNHPFSGCLSKASEGRMAKVCTRTPLPTVQYMVPPSCFGTRYITKGKRLPALAEVNEIHDVYAIDNFWAVEFAPRLGPDNSLEEAADMQKCLAPLKELRRSKGQLLASEASADQACTGK